MKKTYKASCQCGAVRYEADADIQQVIVCNCSRCQRLGLMLAFVPPEDFRLLSGEGATSQYKFNTHVIEHRFCSTCGVQSYAKGRVPKTGAEMVALNVRCFEGVDPDSFPVKKVNGARL
jgi:hypothetical protein